MVKPTRWLYDSAGSVDSFTGIGPHRSHDLIHLPGMIFSGEIGWAGADKYIISTMDVRRDSDLIILFSLIVEIESKRNLTSCPVGDPIFQYEYEFG